MNQIKKMHGNFLNTSVYDHEDRHEYHEEMMEITGL